MGIDHAARDTGRRITMQVRESDPLLAAIAAERIADRDLPRPDIEYTHAMRVKPVTRPAAMAMALPMAA